MHKKQLFADKTGQESLYIYICNSSADKQHNLLQTPYILPVLDKM